MLPFQVINTSNLLVTINSSVNFIIYVIFGEKFKRLFLLLFCSGSALFGTGRDSPDGATRDDSFVSNGDRQSLRLYRLVVFGDRLLGKMTTRFRETIESDSRKAKALIRHFEPRHPVLLITDSDRTGRTRGRAGTVSRW